LVLTCNLGKSKAGIAGQYQFQLIAELHGFVADNFRHICD